MVTVVVAYDNELLLVGVCSVLDADKEARVVGQTQNGDEALRLVREQEPDVLILGINMEQIKKGLQIMDEIARDRSQTRVVVLTTCDEQHYIRAMLQHGAAGCVLEHDGPCAIVDAMQEVAEGHRYLSPGVMEHLVDSLVGDAPFATETGEQVLTDRQREVVQLVATGKTNAEIAEELFISRRTVEAHRAQALRKLELKTPYELVRYAMREGLIPPE